MRRSSERAFDMFTGLLIPANMMNQKRSDLGTRIDSISSGAALEHGSGGIVLLRAAQKSSTFSLFCVAQVGTRDLHRGIISEGSRGVRWRHEPAGRSQAFRHIARHI